MFEQFFRVEENPKPNSSKRSCIKDEPYARMDTFFRYLFQLFQERTNIQTFSSNVQFPKKCPETLCNSVRAATLRFRQLVDK